MDILRDFNSSLRRNRGQTSQDASFNASNNQVIAQNNDHQQIPTIHFNNNNILHNNQAQSQVHGHNNYEQIENYGMNQRSYSYQPPINNGNNGQISGDYYNINLQNSQMYNQYEQPIEGTQPSINDSVNIDNNYNSGEPNQNHQQEIAAQEAHVLIPMISIVFLKALRKFLSGQYLNLCFSLLKITLSIVLLLATSWSCQFNNYNLWVILLVIQSLLTIVYTLRSIKLMKSSHFVEDLATKMRHIDRFNVGEETNGFLIYYSNFNSLLLNEGNQEGHELMQFHRIPIPEEALQIELDYRKISILVLEMKYELKKIDTITMVSGYLQLSLHLSLQAWAIIQFFIQDDILSLLAENQEDCHFNYYRFVFMIVLIGFFQYIDIYIILALTLICFVFILGALVFYCINAYKRDKKRKQFLRSLKPVKFKENNPGLMRTDSDCSICLSQFEPSQKVIILPCQAKHFFHDDCIKGWLKVNSTCPMCRTVFNQN